MSRVSEITACMDWKHGDVALARKLVGDGPEALDGMVCEREHAPLAPWETLREQLEALGFKQ